MSLNIDFSPRLKLLIEQLTKLPGIGQKSAGRIAFHILDQEKSRALALADAIADLKENLAPCNRCAFPIEKGLSCPFCDDPKRDAQQICLVEKAQDILQMERTGMFHGHYHALGGVVSPLDGVDIEDLRIPVFFERLKQGNFSEVLFALSPTMEGETTTIYIADKLKGLGIKNMRLSLGLPMGSQIEFIDALTLSRAILSRVEF